MPNIVLSRASTDEGWAERSEKRLWALVDLGGLRAACAWLYIIREQDPCGVRLATNLGREERVMTELARAIFLLKALAWQASCLHLE